MGQPLWRFTPSPLNHQYGSKVSAENVKWRINRAVRASNLPPAARLIMFVLSDMADAKTGVIPEKHSPSLADLARETGHGESTVKTQLADLERLGWVMRSRPDASERARHIPTGYRLRVGSEGPERTPLKRKPRARSKLSNAASGGQQQAIGEGQEIAPENESEGQEQAPRGPGANRSRARSKPSYLKDDDRNDRNDLNAAADAAAHGDGALFESAPPASPVETEGQRVNRLTAIYTKRVPLSKFVAIAGIVRQAVRANRDNQPIYSDEQISEALNQLADENRTITVETLRIALDGPPRRGPQFGIPHQTYRNPDPSAYYDPKAKP